MFKLLLCLFSNLQIGSAASVWLQKGDLEGFTAVQVHPAPAAAQPPALKHGWRFNQVSFLITFLLNIWCIKWENSLVGGGH